MSLTTTSKTFKKGVKVFFGVAVFYYIILLVVIPNSRNLIKSLIPDKNPPNPSFGQLESLKFIQKQINGPQPKYVLNTRSGKLPTELPSRLRVYKITAPQFSYSSRRNALEHASFLGFEEKDLITDLKEDTYKWRNLLSTGNLEIDTKSGKLILETNLFGKSSEYKSGSIDLVNAKNIATRLFSSTGRLSSDKDSLYEKANQKVYLGKFIGNTIQETKINAEAQLARVDFFRFINGTPIVGPDPKKGLLHAVIRNPTSAKSPFNYPKVNAYFWEIDPVTDAVYPLITVEDAWNAVSQGSGVITNISSKGWNPFVEYTPVRVESILIDNIYLAYYETYEYQQYLQPIYVFEGSFTTKGTEGGTISLYFPALAGEFVKQAPNPEQDAKQPSKK